MGLYCQAASVHCGKLHFDDLGQNMSHDIKHYRQDHVISLLRHDYISTLLPLRSMNSHKYQVGHLVIIAGNQGMVGAAIMACHAALATGIGKITLITHPSMAKNIPLILPDVVCVFAPIIGIGAWLKSHIAQSDALLIGPGLGQDRWAKRILKKALPLSRKKPVLIDADAIRFLAQHPSIFDHAVLTPHDGEASVLAHSSIPPIDRYQQAKYLNQTYGCTIVLKGPGSIIQSKTMRHLSISGTCALAVAGSGDTLSGIIGALLAQGLNCHDAACLGVWLHAHASDEHIKIIGGYQGQRPSHTLGYVTKIINTFHPMNIKE